MLLTSRAPLLTRRAPSSECAGFGARSVVISVRAGARHREVGRAHELDPDHVSRNVQHVHFIHVIELVHVIQLFDNDDDNSVGPCPGWAGIPCPSAARQAG